MLNIPNCFDNNEAIKAVTYMFNKEWKVHVEVLLWVNEREEPATSHMRLRARDHCTSSTLIGGKGGAGQVHFTLCLRAQWRM